MHAKSTPVRSADHCFGIIMHHRLAWWLVEFPDLDATPLRARKLSGRLTPALADWLRGETGDARLGDDIAALNPDSCCWSGEFSYVPAAGGADLFDIDAHPWGSEASELETRGSRVSRGVTASMIDARDYMASRIRERREQFAPEGPVVAFSGGQVWEDHEVLWRGLDSIKARIPEMILATTAQTKGCDAIAQAWAAARGVKVILFKLDRRLGAKAAFVRNDRLLALRPVEAVVCEGSGIQMNLAQKLRQAGVPLHVVKLDETVKARLAQPKTDLPKSRDEFDPWTQDDYWAFPRLRLLTLLKISAVATMSAFPSRSRETPCQEAIGCSFSPGPNR